MILWMALIGKHMGNILEWMFACFLIGGGLSLIGLMIGECMKIPWRGPIFYVNLAGIIFALIVYGMHKWWQWGEDNADRIKGQVARMEEILKKDAEILKIAQADTQTQIAQTIQTVQMPPKKGYESDNIKMINSLSNQAAHYENLSKELEKEKNAALELVSKYKDLYDRSLFSAKLAVDALTKENEDLKEQVARGGVNAITDLE
jgi:hypothetical protein